MFYDLSVICTLIWVCVCDMDSFISSPDASPRNASYYGNRAATLMMLSRFREALEDSQQAVRLDDCFMKVSLNRLSHLEHHLCSQLCMPLSFYTVLRRKCPHSVPQGHLREGKCHLSLGNAMAASRCFQKVLELEPSNREAQQEVGFTWTLHILFTEQSLGLKDLIMHFILVYYNRKESAYRWLLLYFRIRMQGLYWSMNEWRILASKSGISERYFTSILFFNSHAALSHLSRFVMWSVLGLLLTLNVFLLWFFCLFMCGKYKHHSIIFYKYVFLCNKHQI